MNKGILFVEDEEEIRELVIEKVKAAGFISPIYEASDPLQALDLFHKYKDDIDLLICDFYLPVQNGNDLCRMIKDTAPAIKIICLTGDTSVKLEDHKSVIDTVFYKPEGVDELVKLVMD